MDVVTLGELLIDFVSPDPDRGLAEAARFTKAPGGAPANVAVGLQRLGLQAGFIGCVGADPFGEFLAGVLAAEGVDTSQLQRSPSARTTLAFVATRSDGKKDITFYRNPGADAQLDPTRLDGEYLAGCRLFHFCSVSLSQEPARTATLEAAAAAREAGALISFDPNWRGPLWADASGHLSPSAVAEAQAVIGEAMGLADIVKVADEELELVCGTDSPERAAAQLVDAGARIAVVTKGRAGSLARTTGAAAEAAGFTVDAIDSLGAGDSFVAGLLCRLLELPDLAPDAETLQDVLRFANATGALATLQVGVIPALPTRAQAEAFLAQQ